MRKIAITIAAAVIAASTLTAPTTARAGDGGAIAAGIAGGVLGGLFLGSALTPHRYYYESEPVYAEPPPPIYHCYWARGPAYWDDWRGVWVRRHVRVCE